MRAFGPSDLHAEVVERSFDGRRVRIAVLPRVGANLISFQVEGREFIYFAPDLLLADPPQMTGCFHMFPTPCALDRGRYTFAGQEVVQQKRGEVITMHGLLRDEVFSTQVEESGLTSWLEWGPGEAVYEGFPWPGRAEVRYSLLPQGVEVRFVFQNRGESAAPVGYGIHPFWRLEGSRSEVLVKVPAPYRLALDNYVDQNPTGELIPVEGTDYDLRAPRPLTDLFIDDVFWPLAEGEAAEVWFRSGGVRVRLEASPNMRHVVCYSPRGRPFVCVENLSSAPDAQNLYARGHRELSGLALVGPGERWEAWVRYWVEPR